MPTEQLRIKKRNSGNDYVNDSVDEWFNDSPGCSNQLRSSIWLQDQEAITRSLFASSSEQCLVEAKLQG